MNLLEELDELLKKHIEKLDKNQTFRSGFIRGVGISKTIAKKYHEVEITKCQVCPDCHWYYCSDTPFKCENADCKNYDGLCIEGLVVLGDIEKKIKALTGSKA